MKKGFIFIGWKFCPEKEETSETLFPALKIIGKFPIGMGMDASGSAIRMPHSTSSQITGNYFAIICLESLREVLTMQRKMKENRVDRVDRVGTTEGVFTPKTNRGRLTKNTGPWIPCCYNSSQIHYIFQIP